MERKLHCSASEMGSGLGSFLSFPVSSFQRRCLLLCHKLRQCCFVFTRSFEDYFYFHLLASPETFLLKTQVIVVSSVLWNEFQARKTGKTTLVSLSSRRLGPLAEAYRKNTWLTFTSWVANDLWHKWNAPLTETGSNATPSEEAYKSIYCELKLKRKMTPQLCWSSVPDSFPCRQIQLKGPGTPCAIKPHSSLAYIKMDSRKPESARATTSTRWRTCGKGSFSFCFSFFSFHHPNHPPEVRFQSVEKNKEQERY